jgi:hypothetical protein
MNEKYVLRVIKQGQTLDIKIVRSGAGLTGQATVVKAKDATRFQLADVVTLVAPSKLQLKRVDGDLLVSLPEGDLQAPDLVIQDFFLVKDASLQGANISGHMQSYDTSSLSTQSAHMLAVGTEVANLTPLAGAGLISGPWVWAGLGLAVAAAGGGGGGGVTAPTTNENTPAVQGLDAIKSYANGTNKTAPTLADYKASGVKALSGLGETDTSATAEIDDAKLISDMGPTWLQALNSALKKHGDIDKATLQKIAASYYRVLSEADGIQSNTDVYPFDDNGDPLASDYTNIGATVGATLKSLALLNDFVGLSAKTAVDTIEEIDAVAKAAENVMLKAKGATVTSSTGPTIYANNAEWVTGLTALGLKGVTASNIAAVLKAIDDSTDNASGDGSAVDTVQKLQNVAKVAIAEQALKDYANGTQGGSVTAPTLSTYKDAGVKALNGLSETATSASADIDATSVTNLTGATWLQALNSALDHQVGDSTLTTGKLRSMVASYMRILSEADGKPNATSTDNVDVYPGTADVADALAGNNDPSAADYTNIGATVGNAKSVDLLNDYVGGANKTAVDTVEEINAIAKATYNIMLLAGMNTTTPASGTKLPAIYATTDNNVEWIAGLNLLLGLTTATGVNSNNVAAVKSAIADTADTGVGVDTVQEVKDLIKSTVALQALQDFTNDPAALGAKSAAAPTLVTYTDLGIKTFKSLTDTSDASRKDLGDTSTADGALNNGFLTASILNTALDKLAGSTVSKTKVQAMVDAYYRILQEADGDPAINKDVYADTNNDPMQTDYEAIGIQVADAIGGSTNFTLSLLNDAVGRLGTTAVETADKVQALATTANDVMLMAKQTTGAVATASQTDAKLIEGLNALMGLTTITGVNANNLGTFKSSLVSAANDGTETNTVDQLQSLLSLVRLKSFTDDSGTYFVNGASNTKSTTTPTLNDWSTAYTGLKANTSLSDGTDVALNQATYWKTTNAGNGLQALNSALDTFDKANVTETNLQAIVDSYGRILQSADGKPDVAIDVSKVSNDTTISATGIVLKDFINVGVTAGSASDKTGLYYLQTGALLASSMGSVLNTAVDSVQELNVLAGYAENIMKHAAGVSNGYSDAQWTTALTGLGVVGATPINLAAVQNAIKASADDGTGIDTWDELQAIVSLVRLDNYASETDLTQTPSAIDYQSIASANGQTNAYSAVKSAYLNAYNSVIKAKSAINSNGVSTDDLKEAGDMIAAYTKLLDMAEASPGPGIDNVNNTTSLLGTDTDAYGGDLANANNLTVDALNAIFQGAVTYRVADVKSTLNPNGSGTVNAKTIADTFSDVVDQLSIDKVDTVAELAAIGAVLNKLFAMAADATATGTNLNAQQTPSVNNAELALLGLTNSTLTDSELKYFQSSVVYSANNGADINSFAELQALLTAAVVNA